MNQAEQIRSLGKLLLFCYTALAIFFSLAFWMEFRGTGLTITDSFFTIISAITLTGFDSIHAWKLPLEGQGLIMIVIALGALLSISFSLAFASICGKSEIFDRQFIGGLTASEIWQRYLNKASIFLGVFYLLSSVLVFAFWNSTPVPVNITQKIWFSVFHGISIASLAGFTLFRGNFADQAVSGSYLFHFAISCIAIVSALGYPVITDLFSIRRLRERMKNTNLNWSKNTRIALYGLLILVITSGIAFYLSEEVSVLHIDKFVVTIFVVLFNSSAGFSGFYSIPVTAFSTVSIVLVSMLMFIGGSAGSASGGVKVQAIFLAGKGAFRKTRESRAAISTILFALVGIAFFWTMLTITEQGRTTSELGFNSLSAFMNNGMLFGDAVALSVAGKIIMMIAMLAGKIGLIFIPWFVLGRSSSGLATESDILPG